MMDFVAIARLEPSNSGALAEPVTKEPPWILEFFKQGYISGNSDN